MRSEPCSFLQKQRALLACLTLAAAIGIGLPVNALANTTAKTTIMNKVSVNYKDANGAGDFNADATTIVTVNLVKAGLDISNAPSGDAAPPALSCLNTGTSYPSGSTLSVLYALTATANGQDTYNLSISNTVHDVSATVAYNLLTSTGAVAGALPDANPNPATRTLGSAIPTRVVSDTELEFPGGALEGFAIGDLVVVQTTAGARTYLVTDVNAGAAPVYSHVGNQPYTDVGTFVGGLNHPETKGKLTLGAWAANTNVTINGASVSIGGTPAPTFASTNPATPNLPVGEMILVKVDVTASTSTAGANGTVDFTLTTNDSANTPANTQTAACSLGTWVAPNLSITKSVRNFSVAPTGGFTATSTGNPQQILEYQVVVSNTNGQASLVNVLDNVPSYTTLVTHGTYGDGAGGAIFAKVTDNASNTLSLTSAVDTETQPLAGGIETGFGDATGTAPALALKFWLGDTATNVAGGKLPYCSDGSAISADGLTCATGTRITTLTILYQVKID